MPETVQKGIGAAFLVNAEARAFRDFFSVLRDNGIQAIDPLKAHVTIVDCAETQVPVFSSRDHLAMQRAHEKTNAFLSTLPYYELVLTPKEPELKVFGRRLGIAIEEEEFVFGVRSYIGKIFKEEADLSLSNRNYEPHLSVGFKSKGVKSVAKRVNHSPRVPRKIHVVGHDVSEKTFVEDPSRMRSKQPYTRPRHRLAS